MTSHYPAQPYSERLDAVDAALNVGGTSFQPGFVNNVNGLQRFRVLADGGDGYATFNFDSTSILGGLPTLSVVATPEDFYVQQANSTILLDRTRTLISQGSRSLEINASGYSVSDPANFRTAINGASLAGNSFTGLQTFTGLDSVGIRLKSLTSVQYGNLTPGDGDIYLDTTTNRIDARIGGTTREVLDNSGGQEVSGAFSATGLVRSTTGLILGTPITLDSGKLLQVEGNFGTGGGQGIKLRNTNAAGYTEIVFNNDNNRADGTGLVGFGGSAAAGTPNDLYMSSRVGGIQFYTQNAYRARILSNGRFLINTNTDDGGSLLQVNGTAAVTLLALGGGTGPLLRNSGGTIEVRNNANTANAPMRGLSFEGTGTNGSASVEINGAGGSLYFFPNKVSVTGQLRNPTNGTYRWTNGAETVGVTFDVATTDGTLRIRDRLNTTAGSIEVANITASGTGTFDTIDLTVSGATRGRWSGNGGIAMGNARGIGWAHESTGTAGIGTAFYLVSNGLVQLGTLGANANASLNLTNLTASGTVTASSKILLRRPDGTTANGVWESPSWDNTYTAIRHAGQPETAATTAISIGGNGTLVLNAPTGQSVLLRTGNGTRAEVTSAGIAITGDLSFINGANSTRIARATGATGRLQIYRPNDPATPSVEFGGGNDEIRIRGGLGSITHSGSTLNVGSTAGIAIHAVSGVLSLQSNGQTAQTITSADTVFGGSLSWSDVRIPRVAKTLQTECFESTLSAWQETSRQEASATGARWSCLGATPIARQTLPAAATDAATTQALANSIRSLLINFGFAN